VPPAPGCRPNPQYIATPKSEIYRDAAPRRLATPAIRRRVARASTGHLIAVKPFTYRFGQDPWPEELTLLHAYVLPDLARNPGLAALVGACREATRGEPLAHVPDEWLHVTLCQIAVPAHQVSDAGRADLAAEIGRRVAGTGPFTVTAGNPGASDVVRVKKLVLNVVIAQLSTNFRIACP
jgi:hypothetical protein